ncbi:putative membrane protein YfcA [Marisediminicola sp. UYEF4]|uniref:sulfite exporter TauE/SafE family protein n=1 Tax=Marisediminicola sp. UYEF4 TaxID=1756384 RepID=UPI003398C0F9
MSWIEVVVLFVSGTLAGIINTVVGSGSLITFPVLLALGYPPVLANVTNNVGVFPGSISGAIAYRKELKGQLKPVLALATFSALGGLAGALLLLQLPAEVFDGVVPALIVLALLLVVFGPRIKRTIAARRLARDEAPKNRVALFTTTALTGVYGGYFGAAQGVILLSSLSILLPGSLQRANAYKNVLAATANGAAAIVFVLISQVAWLAAGVIAIGAILGGQIGGWVGQRLPPLVLRIVIVVVGLAAIAYFIVN